MWLVQRLVYFFTTKIERLLSSDISSYFMEPNSVLVQDYRLYNLSSSFTKENSKLVQEDNNLLYPTCFMKRNSVLLQEKPIWLTDQLLHGFDKVLISVMDVFLCFLVYSACTRKSNWITDQLLHQCLHAQS